MKVKLEGFADGVVCVRQRIVKGNSEIFRFEHLEERHLLRSQRLRKGQV